MKKILFGLLALVLFSVNSFAQTPTTEQRNKIYNAQIVAMVDISKVLYRQGQSYNDFLAALMIPSPTFPSQDALLKKIYSYVSTGTLECDILKGDPSVLTNYLKDAAAQKTFSGEDANKPPKKWWMIAINWVVNTAATLFAENNGIAPPPTIDFWPEYGNP